MVDVFQMSLRVVRESILPHAGVWMVEGCEQWAHPVGTTMHVGVAAHRETDDRVRVSASPDVPLSGPVMSMIALGESAPAMMGGATPTDPGRILVEASATMAVAPEPRASREVQGAPAGIAAPRVKTSMSMAMVARVMGGAALAGLTGRDQMSARRAASARPSVARRGTRSSGGVQVARARALAHQGAVGCGVTTPTCAYGAPAGRAAVIHAAAA